MKKIIIILFVCLIGSLCFAEDTPAIQIQKGEYVVYVEGTYNVAEDNSTTGDTFLCGDWDEVFVSCNRTKTVSEFLGNEQIIRGYVDGYYRIIRKEYSDGKLKLIMYYHYSDKVFVGTTYTLERL